MKTLVRAWRISNRCLKWWGIFLILLLLIAAIALMTGTLTLNANLDLGIIDNVTNPMLVIIVFALLLFVVFYPLAFLLILPVVYLLSFKPITQVQEEQQE